MNTKKNVSKYDLVAKLFAKIDGYFIPTDNMPEMTYGAVGEYIAIVVTNFLLEYEDVFHANIAEGGRLSIFDFESYNYDVFKACDLVQRVTTYNDCKRDFYKIYKHFMNANGKEGNCKDIAAEESLEMLVVLAEAVFYGSHYEMIQMLPYGLTDAVELLKGITNGMLY